jgi:hypothetical protein
VASSYPLLCQIFFGGNENNKESGLKHFATVRKRRSREGRDRGGGRFEKGGSRDER